MGFSPSALNQVSPPLQCNLLFFMVSPTQEEPQLGVGMEAVPGRTLQTPNFLTHSLVFGEQILLNLLFCLWLIDFQSPQMVVFVFDHFVPEFGKRIYWPLHSSITGNLP